MNCVKDMHAIFIREGAYCPAYRTLCDALQQQLDYTQKWVSGVIFKLSWSRSFPGSSVRAAPGAEDMLTPGDRLSTGCLRHS